jgi:isopentenyl-diphosphate delta-isomerase
MQHLRDTSRTIMNSTFPTPGEHAADEVILVDTEDRQIGSESKLPAHTSGKLHRAFSIFVFGDDGRIMLQQRAFSKYHSGGLWTNTCCGHPRPGEFIDDAAHRRLREEMGFDCTLERKFSFIYKAQLDNGLTEHEFDHVFVGVFNNVPNVNTQEAASWRWSVPEAVDSDILANPQIYTVWFRIAWQQLRSRK